MGLVLAFAGELFGLEVKVYMVKVCYFQKPYRRALMETYGAQCVASPSMETASGRAILAQRVRTRRDRSASRSPKPSKSRRKMTEGDRMPRLRLGAQPRAAASDGDRPRGDRADATGRCVPRHRHWLRRRRFEFCGSRVSLRGRKIHATSSTRASLAVEPAGPDLRSPAAATLSTSATRAI